MFRRIQCLDGTIWQDSSTFQTIFRLRFLQFFSVTRRITASLYSRTLRIDRDGYPTQLLTKHILHDQCSTRYELIGLWGSYECTPPGSRSLIFSRDRNNHYNEKLNAFSFSIFSIFIAPWPKNVFWGHVRSIIPGFCCIFSQEYNSGKCGLRTIYFLFQPPSTFKLFSEGNKSSVKKSDWLNTMFKVSLLHVLRIQSIIGIHPQIPKYVESIVENQVFES